MATGLDMEAGASDPDKPSSTQASVPGGGIPGTNDHGNDAPGGGGGSGSDTRPANGLDPKTCDPKVFNQDCTTDAKTQAGGKSSGSQTQASILAMVVAGAALFWL